MTIETSAPSRPAARAARRLNVAFIPSVTGGLGHVTRTVKLARALERADPSLRISFVLDELGLRPINLEAVRSAGYPVRVLPNSVRHERSEKVRAVLGETDVVIEDTCRRLIAHRLVLPRLKAWISIPMLPLWDELFMDWTLLEHADHILYCYPPGVMPVGDELEPFRGKLTACGPILAPDEMPSRAEARRRLGWGDGCYVTYAPRGFPFGRWFGNRVLRGLVGGVMRLRSELPDLRLVLTAVPDPTAIQPRQLPPLGAIYGVTVEGIVSPERARDILAGGDLVIVEGSSTLFDAAAARTPVLMVPGPIYETWQAGGWVEGRGAGIVRRPGDVTPTSMARALREALEPSAAAARAARLHELVGTAGRDQAVAAVRRVIAEKVPV